MFPSQLDSTDISRASHNTAFHFPYELCFVQKAVYLLHCLRPAIGQKCQNVLSVGVDSLPHDLPTPHPESNWKDQGICARPVPEVQERYTWYAAETEQISCE